MKKYNPADIDNYKGKTFVTSHGSRYSISQEGKILGRPSIEGAEVLHIAGLDFEHYVRVRVNLLYNDQETKEEFDKLIQEVGKEPRPGLPLIISLTLKSFKEKRRNGLITSPLDHIE